MTAEDKVLNYLLKFNTITPKESWLDLGVYRLGAAIFRLRGQGYPISTTIVNVKNRFGESCHMARYTLHKNGERSHEGELQKGSNNQPHNPA